MLDKDIKDCLPCSLTTPKRNNYTDGTLLVANDFQNEQAYHRGLRHLHNAHLHGTGIVCGLDLIEHPAPGCRPENLVLEPGLALDCCGQEIIVPERTLVPVSELLDQDPDLADRLNGEVHLGIGLRRCDHGSDAVPTILPGCGAASTTQFSRVTEGFEFFLTEISNADAQVPTVDGVPMLKWVHSLSFEAEVPMDTYFNDAENRLQVTVQNPSDGGVGRLHFFDGHTQDLTAIADGPEIIAQTSGTKAGRLAFSVARGVDLGDGPIDGVAVWRMSDIGTDAKPAGVITSAFAQIRIAVAPTTGEVFLLEASPKAQLRSFSAIELESWVNGTPRTTQPAPQSQLRFNHGFGGANGAMARGAGMMDISNNDRYLVLTAGAGLNRTYLLDIADLHAGTYGANGAIIKAAARIRGATLPTAAAGFGIVGVRFSHDASVVYLASSDGTTTHIGRHVLTGNGTRLAPAGRGAVIASNWIDFTIAPTEKAVFMLSHGADETRCWLAPIPVEPIRAQAGAPLLVELGNDAVTLTGRGRNLSQTQTADQLFVALEDGDDGLSPDRGLVAIIQASVAACGLHLTAAGKGCLSCEDSDNDHLVLLGHLPNYIAADHPPMRNAQDAGDGDATIDNVTLRRIIPSASALRDAIMCILSQGIAEGPPGAKGEPGLNGRDGVDGTDGVNGTDGKDGKDGTDGKDGKDAGAVETNKIIGLSWKEFELIDMDVNTFVSLLMELGLGVAFEKEINLQAMRESGASRMVVELQFSDGFQTHVWRNLANLDVAGIDWSDSDLDHETGFLKEFGDGDHSKSRGFVLRYNGDDIGFETHRDVVDVRVTIHADRFASRDGLPLDGHVLHTDPPTTWGGMPGGIYRSWFQLKGQG